MDPIRVLFTSQLSNQPEISRNVREAILAALRDSSVPFEVSGPVDRDDLQLEVMQRSTDVVVLDLQSDEFPSHCRKVLEANADLVVFGLADDGRLAAFHLNVTDLGSAGIAETVLAIRARRCE